MSDTKGNEQSLLYVLFLIFVGLAYQEAIPPLRSGIEANGFTFESIGLFAIFFIISLRFLFLNTTIINSRMENRWRFNMFHWMIDSTSILLQSVILVLLAGMVSVDKNISSKITYLDFLVLMLIIELLWFVLYFIFSPKNINPDLRSILLPAILQIICLFSLKTFSVDPYAEQGIRLLLTITFIFMIWEFYVLVTVVTKMAKVVPNNS